MTRGESAEGVSILHDVDGPVERALGLGKPEPDTPDAKVLSQGGRGALRYLTAGRATNVRIALLEQIEANSGIAPVDAEVLASEALTASTQDVKAKALLVSRRFGEEPAMVSAVLELLPRMTRTTANAELVAFFGRRPLPSAKS